MLLTAVLPFWGHAEEIFTEKVGEYTWSYRVVDGGAELCRGGDGSSACQPDPTSILDIPSRLGNYDVQSIGYRAFYEGTSQYKVLEVRIPNTVTNIADNAFSSFAAVRLVRLPSSVKSIGVSAFHSYDFCAIIDEGDADRVRSMMVDSGADVSNVSFVEGYHVEDGVMYADDGKILGVYPHAKQVVFPKGLKDVFSCNHLMKLESVIVPSSAVEVGSYYGCSSLTNVTIHEGPTYVKYRAFYDCSSLTYIRFPKSIRFMSMNVFESCTSLTNIYFSGDAPHLVGQLRNTISDRMSLKDTPSNAVVTVTRESRGWNGDWCSKEKGEYFPLCWESTDRRKLVVEKIYDSPSEFPVGFVTVITEVKSSGAVSVPSEWSTKFPSFTTKYGSNLGKALMMKSGKKDDNGNSMFVWQDYVAGTDPTNPDDKFTASITIVDGAPLISYTPELTDAQKALRTYKTFGKAKLQDKDWDEVQSGHEGDYNFFKVSVEMK